MTARRRNRRIVIERSIADTSLDAAGSGQWEEVGQAWANVQDVLPSRAERLAGGINIATRPARVRLGYRTDITPDMRFVIGSRVMQIVAGPAEVGNRREIEFMCEEYSSAGNPA